MATKPAGVRPLPAPAPPDPSTALVRRLAAASVAALLCAAVIYVVMVRTSIGQRLDGAAYLGAKAEYGPAVAVARGQLQRITADSFAVVLVVIVGIGAVRGRLLLGVGAAFAAGAAVIGTSLLRTRILPRPDLTGATDYLAGNTFPSGHTASAVVCAMALVLVAPPHGRGLAAVFAGAVGWVTAAQVQTAGWHRPSDAIGATLIAFSSMTGVAAVLAARRPVTFRRRVRHRLALTLLGLVGVVDAVVCVRNLLVVVRYLRAHALSSAIPGLVDHDAYLTGITVTVAVVVALLMVLLCLLGGFDLDGRGGRRRGRWPGAPGSAGRDVP